MMVKWNLTMCKVISTVLLVVGILFLVVALLGHESGYSTATACLAAAACTRMRRRKKSEQER